MKNLAVFLFAMFSVFAFSQNVNAAQWPLSATYSNTNGFGLTEVRGTSQEGAAVSAKDAEDNALICLPFLGIGENGEYSCFGLNIVGPVSITASTRLFGSVQNDPKTIQKELNANSNAWMLTAEPVTSFFGISQVKGVSEEGASIAAVDSTDKSLFCLPFLGLIGEEGDFTCFGMGITPPVTVTAKSSLFNLLSGRADATVNVNAASN